MKHKNTLDSDRKGELFPETEGFLIAIQDQVIATKNYQKYIIKGNNRPMQEMPSIPRNNKPCNRRM